MMYETQNVKVSGKVCWKWFEIEIIARVLDGR